MAWEWSHTAEGIEGARQRLERKGLTWLRECHAENCAAVPETDGARAPALDLDRYAFELRHARDLCRDVLVDAIWRAAEEIRTCDNGGHALWMCPWGCHTVPPEPVRGAVV